MTKTLSQCITQCSVAPGHVSAWWLGGSGFAFKSPAGTQVWIDPYLSDIVAEIFGQKRAFPAPISVEDAQPDFVICTHLHEDHLDPIFIPALARARPNCVFLMPPTAMGRARTWGVPNSRIVPMIYGQVEPLRDMSVTAVPARHIAGPGFEAPDAMGVILRAGAVSIYHTGDTEYDVRLRDLRELKLSMATFCINGVSGNMNAREAALLAWHLDAKIVVPHHHLLWAKEKVSQWETLDPNLFEETYRRLGGAANVVLPKVGCEIDVPSYS